MNGVGVMLIPIPWAARLGRGPDVFQTSPRKGQEMYPRRARRNLPSLLQRNWPSESPGRTTHLPDETLPPATARLSTCPWFPAPIPGTHNRDNLVPARLTASTTWIHPESVRVRLQSAV